MPLKGKTMVVTGGSRGVGRAVVMELAKRHANVVFTFRKDEESAERLIKAAVALGGSATGHRVNVCDGAEVKAFIKSVVRDYQRIDGLVNNAGIRMDRTLLYMEEREWEEVLGVNLTGVFHVTKAVIPYMLKARRGRIVNIGSVSGIQGLSGQTNYSAAKAGLHGFTKALAKETASYGIAVNAVAPGPVETEMLQGLSEEYLERLLSGVPTKRLCLPEEVAMLVRFLLDETMSPDYLTGQVLALDGGMGL